MNNLSGVKTVWAISKIPSAVMSFIWLNTSSMEAKSCNARSFSPCLRTTLRGCQSKRLIVQGLASLPQSIAFPLIWFHATSQSPDGLTGWLSLCFGVCPEIDAEESGVSIRGDVGFDRIDQTVMLTK